MAKGRPTPQTAAPCCTVTRSGRRHWCTWAPLCGPAASGARAIDDDVHRCADLARPEGFEHALPTIVIEGVEELVEALRAA